jgi:hypothetical protein
MGWTEVNGGGGKLDEVAFNKGPATGFSFFPYRVVFKVYKLSRPFFLLKAISAGNFIFVFTSLSPR